jgi:hypothetical protein
MDPGVKPVAVSVYPPDGGVGPFDVYNPATGTNKAHFYVNFNKLMNVSTFTSKTVTCQSGGESYNLYAYEDVGYSEGDRISFKLVPKSSSSPPGYLAGKQYIVTIDSLVEDKNGNRLGRRYCFSFQPEPNFRVTGITLDDNDTLIENKGFGISFSGKMTSGIINQLQITPPINNLGKQWFDADSTMIWFYMDNITPSTKYTIVMNQNCTDGSGEHLHSSITKSFFSRAFNLIWGGLQDPERLDSPLELCFSYPIDSESVVNSVLFLPDLNATVNVSGNYIMVNASNDFSPNTNYTVTITSGLKTARGFSLPASVNVAFTTAAFSISHEINDGETNVSRLSRILINVNGRLDSSTVAQAISISPKPDNLRIMVEDYSYSYYPNFSRNYPAVFIKYDNGLASSAKYTVRISTVLRSFGGFQLAKPDSFSFTTGTYAAAGSR